MVENHRECTAHGEIIAKLENYNEAYRELKDEITRIRRSLQWLTVAVATIAASALGSDGVAVVKEAIKVVSP